MGEEASSQTTQDPVGLFLYIPFCRTHCTFCDFNVYTRLAALQPEYVAALVKQIEQAGERELRGRGVRTISFGGGTPSLLTSSQLGLVLQACAGYLEIMREPEISIEVNPGTVDREKLLAFREMGMNRLSIGVETLSEAVLKRTGRAHTVAESQETYELARRVGFGNLNVDLIYGWPGQTLGEWERDLRTVLAWQPEHFSLYGLQVEPGTTLERQIRRGMYAAPVPDTQAEMYTSAEGILGEAGYRHYEISNWAARGEGGEWLKSRHNLTYWLNQEYLGIGAGAHSYLEGSRYWNQRHPREYIRQVLAGADPVVAREQIGRDLEMAETMIVGLRLDSGVETARFEARFGTDPAQVYGEQIRLLREWKLIEASVDAIRLTPRGRLVSNQVLWRFLPD